MITFLVSQALGLLLVMLVTGWFGLVIFASIWAVCAPIGYLANRYRRQA